MEQTTDMKMIADLIDEYVAAGHLPVLAYTFLAAVLMSVAVAFVFFLFSAIGLYRLNKRLGTKGAGLAFIPGLSGYAFGAAADGLKKRKPSNYCIHLLMLNLFYFAANAVYYYKAAERFIGLYHALMAGSEIETVALLEGAMTVSKSDLVFYMSHYVIRVLSFLVTFVSFFAFSRILQLTRCKGTFLLLIGSLFAPQVMDITLFVIRNRPLYPNPPVFQMPNMDEFDQDDGDDFRDGGDGENK